MDITPVYNAEPAEKEITTLPLVSDTTNQVIGGFTATPTSLVQGKVTLNAAGEQVLVGNASAPLTGAGVFIGNAGDGTYDFRAGDPSGNYIHYDESAGTLIVIGSISVSAGGTIGGFSVGTDYIKDAADSFGLASTVTGGNDVRFWAGANFTNRATAPAIIYEDGSAYFKNVQVGGANFQYQMNDQGIYTFGDGSDGTVTLNGTNTYSSFASKSGLNYTLTRDVFAVSITIQNNVFLYTNGYRIFCQNSITLQSGGQILNDGNAASGATGGAAIADGYLKGGGAGGTGGNEGAKGDNSDGSTGGSGSAGTTSPNSLSTQNGVAGAIGNSGGGAGAHSGGVAGSVGGAATPTKRNVAPVLLWNFMSFFDVKSDGTLARYTAAAPGSGGAGGGGGAAGAANNGINTTAGNGGAGGGGGGAGGIIFIAARALYINAGSNIFVRGGAGGNATNGHDAVNHTNPTQAAGGGGGGGGSGGAGGIVFLVYNLITNAGTITVTGGAGGTKGLGGAGLNGGGSGIDGTDGNSGAAGETITVNMAL